MTVIKNIYRLLKDNRGVTIAAFAIVIPIVVAAAGVATDMSRAYLVKKKLGNSVDSAALAVAGSSGDTAALESKMNAYFEKNFEDGRLGDLLRLDLFEADSEIRIEAEARVNTVFMRIWGKDFLDVYAESIVKKELRGIETVLVMDNTGSMGNNNNIDALRVAARSFIDIMFDRAPDPNVIKIGLVPYSTSVNVGRYGLGLNPDGSQYAGGVPFVNDVIGGSIISYTTSYNSSNGWLGCVIEDEPTDVTDHIGPWNMYRYCLDSNDDPYCHLDSDGDVRRRVNYVCPTSYVTPLGSDQAYLIERVNTMIARGHTLGNYGMVWGWRLISPTFPFEEGAPYDDQEWRKAVIMMTDGQNTMHPYYSAYGPTQDHAIGTTQENLKFAEVCEAMKNEGIIIYTVTFTSSINETTKNFYRECASDETKYYDAPAQADLIDAFEAISRELSNLYIKK